MLCLCWNTESTVLCRNAASGKQKTGERDAAPRYYHESAVSGDQSAVPGAQQISIRSAAGTAVCKTQSPSGDFTE